MKICKKCLISLNIEYFPKDNKNKDGLKSYCTECNNQYLKDYHQRNRTTALLKGKLYREANKYEISEIKKAWYSRNKEYCSYKGKQYYIDNKNIIKEKTSNYYIKNKEKMNKAKQSYYEKNKTVFKQSNIKWKRENRGRYNAMLSKRRRAARIATPAWLTEDHWEEIAEFYNLAQDLAWLNEGIKFHVDHIVPLQGKNVCGLHVPWNLQLLSPVNNKKKNNKF